MKLIMDFINRIKKYSSKFINWVVFLIFLISLLLGLYLYKFYRNPELLINFFDLFDKASVIKENYAVIFEYPQIIVTIGFLIAYVYFFHSVKRRGVSILESNDLETKQFAFVIFIIKILSGLIVVVAYCYYLFKIESNDQLILIIIAIPAYVVIKTNIFRKYQEIINKYNQIEEYIRFLQNDASFYSKWIFSNLEAILDIIILMTFLTAFFGIYRGFNLFTVLLFEFILIEIFILISIVNKIPKHKLNIHTQNQEFNEIFIIYESPKKYLMILDKNDKKTMICENSIKYIDQ